MLIRKEQFEAFRANADMGFVHRVAAYLRGKYGDTKIRLASRELLVKEIKSERLEQMVQTGIARARQYGIQWESALAAYVVLMFVSAPSFDSHPAIQNILTDSSTEPDLRIDAIAERTDSQVWVAVKAAYDPLLWGLG